MKKINKDLIRSKIESLLIVTGSGDPAKDEEIKRILVEKFVARAEAEAEANGGKAKPTKSISGREG